MNGIVMTQEIETRATQALAQLVARSTARQSARSRQQEMLERIRPQIVAARAARRSWATISAALKPSGIVVSKETLRRTFEPTKVHVKKSRKSTPRKSVFKSSVNAPIKSTEMHETIDVEFVRIDVPEMPVGTAPELVVTIKPEITVEPPVLIVENEPEILETVDLRRHASAMFGSGLE